METKADLLKTLRNEPKLCKIYSKKNCTKCNGKGYLTFAKDVIILDEPLFNIQICSCVLRNLSRG